MKTRSFLPLWKPFRDVYFILCEDADAVKIGLSENAPERLNSLQIGCPLPLRLLAVIPRGGSALEAELHARFEPYRTHGEWYRAAPEIMDYIAEHANEPVLAPA